jgi:hypothetical protein
MGIPGQRIARSRTFRVEALESRELLSTAGHGTHLALAAAPVSQVALVSRANQDPVIKTKLQGQLLFSADKITFSAGGFAEGLPNGLPVGELTPVLFKGFINKFEHAHNNFTFKKGGAEFFDQTNINDYFIFEVTSGSTDKQKFTAKGHSLPSKFGSHGIFQHYKATFTANGTAKSNGDLTLDLTIHYQLKH